MTRFEEIATMLNEKKNGQFLAIKFRKVLDTNKVGKANGVEADRVTEVIMRKGLDYTALKSTKEAVENGKVLTHELPWGEWKKGFEGLGITHKGNDYIRLYISGVPTVEYHINGVVATREEAEASGMFLKSNFSRSGDVETITVKVENIIEVNHREAV